MTELNLVPHGPVAFELMREFADQLGWKVDRRSLKRAEHSDSPEYVWKFRGGSVTLVKNSALRRDYFVVDAVDPAAVAAEIRSRIPCVEPGDAVAALVQASSPDERIDALHLIAAAAPADYDHAVFQAVVDNAGQPQPLVRLAAVVAASHLRWRQLRGMVERLSDSDESDPLSSLSHNVLYLTSWSRG
jgi:hypothetical protein